MATLSRVLIIDQDHKVSDVLEVALKSSYDIDTVATGKAAIYKADIFSYDAVILDLSIQDITGLALCQQLKERGLRAPILILSSNSSVQRKIELLDGGANDYITKPFSLGELKARLGALIRTYLSASLNIHKPLSRFGVTLNKERFEVTRDSKTIILRKKEFSVLEYLINRAGSVVSREELLNALWHNSDELWTNTLDVHIKYLRDKLDRPFDYPLIHTVHGRGYKFDIISGSNFNSLIKRAKKINKS
jgi:DNA-binding response OmpR family regulator